MIPTLTIVIHTLNTLATRAALPALTLRAMAAVTAHLAFPSYNSYYYSYHVFGNRRPPGGWCDVHLLLLLRGFSVPGLCASGLPSAVGPQEVPGRY